MGALQNTSVLPLESKDRVISLLDSPKKSGKAKSVSLNEAGYKTIANLHSEREMAAFVTRVAEELGYEIKSESKLNGVVPYYSGKKATQSFKALKSELAHTSTERKGWAKK